MRWSKNQRGKKTALTETGDNQLHDTVLRVTDVSLSEASNPKRGRDLRTAASNMEVGCWPSLTNFILSLRTNFKLLNFNTRVIYFVYFVVYHSV